MTLKQIKINKKIRLNFRNVQAKHVTSDTFTHTHTHTHITQVTAHLHAFKAQHGHQMSAEVNADSSVGSGWAILPCYTGKEVDKETLELSDPKCIEDVFEMTDQVCLSDCLSVCARV